MKKIEDSSCSLPLHFWSPYRSPFSVFYIPFQSSGSQESNASNHVRFGAEMRKIWPSEDNCSRLVQNSHNTFNLCEACAKLVRSLCETRTTPLACAKLTQHSHNTFQISNTGSYGYIKWASECIEIVCQALPLLGRITRQSPPKYPSCSSPKWTS